MQMLKLIWFSMQQMSRMGLAQAGAEMTGGDVLRARADAHRELHRQTGMAIRAKVYQGAAKGLGQVLPDANAQTSDQQVQ